MIYTQAGKKLLLSLKGKGVWPFHADNLIPLYPRMLCAKLVKLETGDQKFQLL